MALPFKGPLTCCPHCCSHEIECLEDLSRRTWVDYYRCRRCSETWAIERGAAEPPCDTSEGAEPGLPFGPH